MADYSTKHANALKKVSAKGSAVTQTRISKGSRDPLTGQSTDTVTTIEGWALRDAGNPKRYEALGLTESAAPTVIFVPTTFGDTEPGLDDTLTWAGEAYQIRDVLPLAPDGNAILYWLVIQR